MSLQQVSFPKLSHIICLCNCPSDMSLDLECPAPHLPFCFHQHLKGGRKRRPDIITILQDIFIYFQITLSNKFTLSWFFHSVLKPSYLWPSVEASSNLSVANIMATNFSIPCPSSSTKRIFYFSGAPMALAICPENIGCRCPVLTFTYPSNPA